MWSKLFPGIDIFQPDIIANGTIGNGRENFVLIRYVLVWVPILLIAIANGAPHQLVFAKVMPELRAHQLSTTIGSVLIGLFIWAVIRIWPPSSARHALSIGLI